MPLSAFSSYEHSVGRDRVSHWQPVRVDVDLVRADARREPEPGRSGHRSRRRAARDAGLGPGAPAGQRAPVPDEQGNQPLAILGTLLIVYIVLGVLYESYVHPLTILSTLPSAGVGALLALQFLNTEFSLVAMLGCSCWSAS